MHPAHRGYKESCSRSFVWQQYNPSLYGPGYDSSLSMFGIQDLDISTFDVDDISGGGGVLSFCILSSGEGAAGFLSVYTTASRCQRDGG